MLFDNEKLSWRNGDSSTVGVRDWLLFDVIGLLNLVPIVGSIVAIVLYIVIAATRASAPSVQSRIIVNFIWLGVWLLVMFVALLLVVAGVLDISRYVSAYQVAWGD